VFSRIEAGWLTHINTDSSLTTAHSSKVVVSSFRDVDNVRIEVVVTEPNNTVTCGTVDQSWGYTVDDWLLKQKLALSSAMYLFNQCVIYTRFSLRCFRDPIGVPYNKRKSCP